MNHTLKAKQLYEACNTDPKENCLMPPPYYEKFPKHGSIYYSMITMNLLTKYVEEEFEDDWIPFTRETFNLGKTDREGWKSIDQTVYRMEKKGFVETVMTNGKKFIRLATDEFYDPEVYKRENYAHIFEEMYKEFEE